MKPMKKNKIWPLALACFLLLLAAISAQGRQNFDPTYTNDLYSDEYSTSGAYSSTVPDGAPLPAVPSSAQELGFSIPEEESDSYQAPPSAEISQSLISEGSAFIDDETPSNLFSGQLHTNQNYMGSYAADDNRAMNLMVSPKGTASINRLYISYVPKTIAGCKLYGWLPMWLQTFSNDPIWIYEWYPSGSLSVNYLGYASIGWQKKWFNGDTPGWHILQFYSKGWSNYIYIYVYGKSSGQWTDLGPYTEKPSYKGTASVTMRSSWLRGYDVYLDGTYIGTEGRGSDFLDGVYSFKVPGDMSHTIVLMKNGQGYPETGTFLSGSSYRFTV